jgi:pimeloyl-ACP methyl ester carboxylesterase
MDSESIAATTADGLPVEVHRRDIHTTVGRFRVEEVIPTDWEGHRAALLLPGPVAIGSFHRIPVPGFDAATPLGRAGRATITVDLLGTGDSEHPPDGTTCTLDLQARGLAEVLATLRDERGYAPLAVIGESWGAAVGLKLAADPEAVSACVVCSTLFQIATPPLDAMARSDGMRAFLDSLPDGYLPVDEQIWGPLAAPMAPEARAWTLRTQQRRFASAPMRAVFDLPYFDPGVARVPGLVIRGGEDPMVSEEDTVSLAAAYGRSGAAKVTLAGAGHIPRVEPDHRDAYWSTVLGFLD